MALDAQQGMEFAPQRAGELGPSVGNDVVGDPVSGDPGPEKGADACRGRGVPERDGLRPSGVPIHNGEEV